MSGGNRAKNHWNHLRQADQRQRQRRMRALIQFPVNGHDEHLLAERGDKSAGQIAEKIAITQNGVSAFRRRPFTFRRWLVRQIFR